MSIIYILDNTARKEKVKKKIENQRLEISLNARFSL